MMFTSKDRVEGIIRRKFSKVKNSLDEDELSFVIEGLINQNNDLTRKLEHIQTLADDVDQRVQDSVVPENNLKAREQKKERERGSISISELEEAEQLIAIAKQEAEEIIWEKVLSAEQEAWDIVKAAEEEAETFKKLAREEATNIINEAKSKSEAAERKAREILTEALDKVDSIKALAEEEAGRLISEVKETAERMAEARISSAEEEGQNIIAKAVKTAELEAQRIKREAEKILLMSKKMGEDDVKDKFNAFCEELLSGTEYPDIRRAIPVTHANADKKEESLALYQGTVELSVKPPVALDRIVKLHRHLRANPGIRVMKMRGTKDKGLRMQLLLKDRTPLLDILRTLPEVKTASDLRQEAASKAGSPLFSSNKPVNRIVVRTKE